MALTACRECSAEVSTEARICPHCGAAPTSAPVSSFLAIMLVVGAVVLIAVVVLGPS